ncbi:MFS general substrate transporter [Penicillium daleae]|uniref:MFS general substrate transporter n=1 Tax=Penicillium daleae TaxID=63821 RepID=A0AAD6G8E9_9EURO|nr:MFS general substrate transporter [Penicillium daleae]KAJ5462083.1 MFS general substrate transporter [Penicillium daleae]
MAPACGNILSTCREKAFPLNGKPDVSPSWFLAGSYAEDVDELDHDSSPFSTVEKVRSDRKRELTEDDCYDKLGFSFAWYKRWMILTVIFTVRVSL